MVPEIYFFQDFCQLFTKTKDFPSFPQTRIMLVFANLYVPFVMEYKKGTLDISTIIMISYLCV